MAIVTEEKTPFAIRNTTPSYQNLVVESTSVSAVSVTTDGLTVDGVFLANVGVSAAITSSGAGGLDTGAEAANTWYNIFVISNDDGSIVNGLLSLSSTSPTMPSGYTKKRRVGAVKNNASSNFLQFVQEGNKLRYYEDWEILAGGAATAFTLVSSATYIPPTSRTGILVFVANSGTGHNNIRTRPTNATVTTGTLRTHQDSGQGWDSQQAEQILDSSQAFDYRNAQTGSSAYIYVSGYYDRI